MTTASGTVLGRFEARAGGGGRIQPTDRRTNGRWRVPPGEEGGAENGEIVVASPLPHRGRGPQEARVTERLGSLGDARSISLICIHEHDIPYQFSAAALAEADAPAVALGEREDLRDIPLVTIDGEDARDFDDAVWAAPESDGFRLIVAIADVAHYVPPGSALDREARLRGNSVYFPDRVVPMLPEALSTHWCSLRPAEDRLCVFADLRIDAQGHKTAHRFGRGLMRSTARLTYEQAQAAQDDHPHLFAAFRALLAARQERGTLDLDLAERQILLRDGKVAAVRPRVRLDSHRLVEEFMILANVAAAETLERAGRPCLFRVHAPPSDDKLAALRTMLHRLGIGLPAGHQIRSRDLDQVLRRVAGTPDATLVHEIMLRSQSQAEYAADNIGHFGLALPRYAHFTSPIRRYADLLVHRALLGTEVELGTVGRHVTGTERQAALAERAANARYLAAFMADQIGTTFAARVSGVQRFGIFVTLPENGATGLVPMRGLPDDLWVHDEPTQTLSGRRSRMIFRLAQQLDVQLVDTDPLTGALSFALPAIPTVKRRGSR